MILQKIFLKLKSPGIADSRFMHTAFMQHFVKVCLILYNAVAPRTGLCQRVKKGMLGTGNSIHPSAIIDYDRVIIGNNCTIGHQVVIEKNTLLGNNVIIGDGAVIGSEGFELRRIAGGLIPVAHLGGVIIRDNARIGPHTCVDRSALDEYTEVGESADISSRVQIGHGITVGSSVSIGEGTMIGGYSFIGSGTRIGRRCSLADGISVAEGCDIPDNTIVTRSMKRSPTNTQRSV